MKKLLFLFIPVFAFAQTPYVTQTVTVTNDSTGTPIAAVVTAYGGGAGGTSNGGSGGGAGTPQSGGSGGGGSANSSLPGGQ